MTTVDSSTLHNNLVESSQENLQEEANSMPTQAPTEFDKSAIVQSSPEEFDAVAEAKLIIEKRYTKIQAFERLVKIYCPGVEYSDEGSKIVEYLGIEHIFRNKLFN